ncbi:hypothetical protein PIB30_089867, partial [Stylosanthes scabra]|nr:hypothetical protein [Stylosanthes scabra]
MGPARPLGGGAVAVGGALMMIVCAYIGSTSFLPVLPATDPRPGSSAPGGRASERAGLHGEGMGPARPLGGGAVAVGGALMMIVCAYIGRLDHTSTNAPDPIRTPHTSFLPVLPAADPRPGSSGPAGRASGWAGLHGEEMGPARPLCGSTVALGGPLMMIVCAYIGRYDHTRTNAPDGCLGESSTRMGDLLGNLRVAPLFQYLFFTRPSGRRPSSRKLGSGGSGIRKGGAPWRGDGPREAFLRRRCCPRRRAYDDCVRIHWQYLFFTRPSGSRPSSRKLGSGGRASGRAGLNGEEMGPAMPLGGGAVALGGP